MTTLFDEAIIFEPHITVTSDIEINTNQDVNRVLNSALAAMNSIKDINGKKRELHQNTEPLIQFKKLEFGKRMFEKVYMSIDNRPNLLSFARIIRELFVEFPKYKDQPNPQQLAMSQADSWSVNDFKPHLSLVYSNLYNINSALARTIKARIEDLLSVNIDEDNNLLDTLVFPGLGTLRLVKCEGPVKSWEILGELDYNISES